MTTRSSAHSNEAAIPATAPAGTDDATEPPNGDQVDDLLRAAVADRPLEDIVHLVTLLEQSPEHAQARVAALRAVGVDRSVEDVTRLVALLTLPPRDAAGADEAIRSAAASRPLADVTRLAALLHRASVEPHCVRELIRAASTGRPVEELAQLIGQLAEECRMPAESLLPPGECGEQLPTAVQSDDEVRDVRPPVANPSAAPSCWPSLLAALALLVCAALCFPSRRYDTSVRAYGFALGVSVLCLGLGLLLTARPALPTLAVAVVVPAALAAGQLLEGRLHSAGLSRALDLTLAPAWLAGTAAVCASLAALTALLARMASQPPVRAVSPPPLAETSGHSAD